MDSENLYQNKIPLLCHFLITLVNGTSSTQKIKEQIPLS